MATFLDDRDRARLMARLTTLTSASQPRWGKFTVAGMLCHLRECARMASGELHVPVFLHKEQRPAPPHPLFGPLTRKEWGALMHKHVDHHLRQFGA